MPAGREPVPERTPEERARAAAERAARRAARQGGAAPPPESFTHEAPPAEPAHSDAAPSHTGEWAPAEPNGSEPPHTDADHPDAREWSASEPNGSTAERSTSESPSDTAEWVPEWDPEPAPVGVHSDTGSYAPAAPAAPPRGPRAATTMSSAPRPTTLRPGRVRPPAARRPTGAGGRWRRRLAAAVAIGLLAAAFWFINSTFQPFHGSGSGGVRVVIPPGTDAANIGDRLERAGVIDSSFFFLVNATLTLRRGDLRDGSYLLRKGMTNGQAIDALMQGPKAKVVKTFAVTIPEGRSRRESAPLVRQSGVEGDYLKATARPQFRSRARKLALPKGSKTLEGFLFPATFTLTAGATANDLVDKQLDAFKDNFGKLDTSYAKRRNLTRYDVLIIASMIEREASLDRERPLVAAVIYNRLKRGMPLGIDATIRYAENNWTRPLRVSELERDGPYNTRLNRGLPPTPIGNPGLASLRAALKPAGKSYLFYVRKPGKSGEHAFSSTDAQFQRDVKRYQDSREK
jgi:UPF0755 protein